MPLRFILHCIFYTGGFNPLVTQLKSRTNIYWKERKKRKVFQEEKYSFNEKGKSDKEEGSNCTCASTTEESPTANGRHSQLKEANAK